MGTQTTTGRFGAHEVPELILSHRSPGHPVSAAVWVCAPMPLRVDEVASVLYRMVDDSEEWTAADARRVVTDIVVNGGIAAVIEMFHDVAAERLTGDQEVAKHWAFCTQLALAAIAAAVDPQTGIPQQSGVPADTTEAPVRVGPRRALTVRPTAAKLARRGVRW
jgi:hypothetical protein